MPLWQAGPLLQWQRLARSDAFTSTIGDAMTSVVMQQVWELAQGREDTGQRRAHTVEGHSNTMATASTSLKDVECQKFEGGRDRDVWPRCRRTSFEHGNGGVSSVRTEEAVGKQHNEIDPALWCFNDADAYYLSRCMDSGTWLAVQIREARMVCCGMNGWGAIVGSGVSLWHSWTVAG